MSRSNFIKNCSLLQGSDQQEANIILENVDKTLNNDQKEFCEANITEQEIKTTLNLLKINKSPGDDGIVSEFYKEYWYLIHKEFTRAVQHIPVS